jgi:hypothetical protein
MTKRISIKGQGADIFFGEDGAPPEQPVSPTQTAPAGASGAATSVRPHGGTSGRQDVQTSVGASGQTAESRDADEGRFLAGLVLPAPLRRRLRAVLRDERRIHTTVRFSPEEMAALRDLVYELEARKGIKVTRNEVMRIALHFFLEDYGIRKKESLLLQVLKAEEE